MKLRGISTSTGQLSIMEVGALLGRTFGVSRWNKAIYLGIKYYRGGLGGGCSSHCPSHTSSSRGLDWIMCFFFFKEPPFCVCYPQLALRCSNYDTHTPYHISYISTCLVLPICSPGKINIYTSIYLELSLSMHAFM